MDQKRYWYCAIEIKGINRDFSYISDLGELTVGTYVRVPFGQSNTSRVGMVKSCGEYAADAALFPPDKTKHISSIASKEEYLADATGYVDNPDDFFDDVN